MSNSSLDEKISKVEAIDLVQTDNNHLEHEVFKKTEDGVDFRTVGWPRASIIFLKVQFAIGVLGIPSALYTLGALPGSLLVIAWGALNTCLYQSKILHLQH